MVALRWWLRFRGDVMCGDVARDEMINVVGCEVTYTTTKHYKVLFRTTKYYSVLLLLRTKGYFSVVHSTTASY